MSRYSCSHNIIQIGEKSKKHCIKYKERDASKKLEYKKKKKNL